MSGTQFSEVLHCSTVLVSTKSNAFRRWDRGDDALACQGVFDRELEAENLHFLKIRG